MLRSRRFRLPPPPPLSAGELQTSAGVVCSGCTRGLVHPEATPPASTFVCRGAADQREGRLLGVYSGTRTPRGDSPRLHLCLMRSICTPRGSSARGVLGDSYTPRRPLALSSA